MDMMPQSTPLYLVSTTPETDDITGAQFLIYDIMQVIGWASPEGLDEFQPVWVDLFVEQCKGEGASLGVASDNTYYVTRYEDIPQEAIDFRKKNLSE